MLGHGADSEREDVEFVDLLASGTPAKGEFHCAECGYGVMVSMRLPACPMCAGESWERSSWSPYSRSPSAL